MTLEESLTRVSPKYFRSNIKNAEIALRMSDSGGYPWTTIPVESRNQYMTSIEKAVAEENIVDFCNVIASELKATKK